MIKKKVFALKIISISILLVLFFILALFFILKSDDIKMSDNEITEIIGKITDDEILAVHYYKKCNVLDSEYEKIYIVVTKLKEKFVHMMGEFEYKYYFLDKDGNIFSENYNSDDKGGLCKE